MHGNLAECSETFPSALGLQDRLSSRDSGGQAISELRITPASCSNHGEEVARPLLRRDHRASACRGSAKSPFAWETPVQGLDSPDGLDPGDGEWL